MKLVMVTISLTVLIHNHHTTVKILVTIAIMVILMKLLEMTTVRPSLDLVINVIATIVKLVIVQKQIHVQPPDVNMGRTVFAAPYGHTVQMTV